MIPNWKYWTFLVLFLPIAIHAYHVLYEVGAWRLAVVFVLGAIFSIFFSKYRKTIVGRMNRVQNKVLTWIRSGELQAINVATDRKLGSRPRFRIEPTAFDSFKLRRAVTPLQKASRSRKVETGVPSYF